MTTYNCTVIYGYYEGDLKVWDEVDIEVVLGKDHWTERMRREEIKKQAIAQFETTVGHALGGVAFAFVETIDKEEEPEGDEEGGWYEDKDGLETLGPKIIGPRPEEDLDGAFLCEYCRTEISTDDYLVLNKKPEYRKDNVHIIHDICVINGVQVLDRSGTLLLVQEKEA